MRLAGIVGKCVLVFKRIYRDKLEHQQSKMSSQASRSTPSCFYQHDDPELLDWLDKVEKSTYYECFDSTTFKFYFFNEETGDETIEEPDKNLYNIVRYTTVEPFPQWLPEPSVALDGPISAPLQEEFFTIPAISSRETSCTSVASLIELPRGVELRTPYQSLMSHLQGSDVELDGWKSLPTEDQNGPEMPGRTSRAVSIDGEIPPAGSTDQGGSVVDMNPQPRRSKRLLKWGLLGGTLSAAVILLMRRR